MNIETAIKKAFLDLKNENIESALIDSEILMSKVLREDRGSVLLNSERSLSDQDYKSYRELISNRLKHKPIAYLIGEKSFWKHEFVINNKVLIPRPDTESIVEEVLKIYKNKSKIKFLEDKANVIYDEKSINFSINQTKLFQLNFCQKVIYIQNHK